MFLYSVDGIVCILRRNIDGSVFSVFAKIFAVKLSITYNNYIKALLGVLNYARMSTRPHVECFILHKVYICNR